jgi:hypothetical protein
MSVANFVLELVPRWGKLEINLKPFIDNIGEVMSPYWLRVGFGVGVGVGVGVGIGGIFALYGLRNRLCFYILRIPGNIFRFRWLNVPLARVCDQSLLNTRYALFIHILETTAISTLYEFQLRSLSRYLASNKLQHFTLEFVCRVFLGRRIWSSVANPLTVISSPIAWRILSYMLFQQDSENCTFYPDLFQDTLIQAGALLRETRDPVITKCCAELIFRVLHEQLHGKDVADTERLQPPIIDDTTKTRIRKLDDHRFFGGLMVLQYEAALRLYEQSRI